MAHTRVGGEGVAESGPERSARTPGTQQRVSAGGGARSGTRRGGAGEGGGNRHYGVAGAAALFPALAQARNPLEVITGVVSSPLVHLVLAVLGAVVVAFWVALAYWAYKDAARRQYAPLFSAVLCLLVPFAGVLLYVILRPPEYALDYEERQLELAVLERELAGGSEQCRTCAETVEAAHLYCPHCGSALKDACGECGCALEDGYAYCPACGRASHRSRTAAPRRRDPGGPAAEAQQGGRAATGAAGGQTVETGGREHPAPSPARNGTSRRP